jgi:hypothetical protein
MTKKIWVIRNREVHIDDYHQLQSIGFTFNFINAACQEFVVDGERAPYKIVTQPSRVEIITTCESQEIILKLKYGSNLFLLAEVENYAIPISYNI